VTPGAADHAAFCAGRQVMITGGPGFIGSVYSDSTKFQRAAGWQPGVALREGLGRTVEFCRNHLDCYLEAPR
jgi:dTDP-D-glucose 4,6-dehydratase